jgi:hypothetical protein
MDGKQKNHIGKNYDNVGHFVAMMVLIYKKANGLSYKTAKRRFAIEVRNLASAMFVVRCGGNPDRIFKT